MTHTTERVPVHQAPGLVHPAPQPTVPAQGSLDASLIWGLIAVGLVAAVALVLMSITSDTDPRQTMPGGPPITSFQPGVPLSADAAERHLADQGGGRP